MTLTNRSRPGLRLAGVLLLALSAALPALVTVRARADSGPIPVPADVETTPVNKAGDSADDPAIWINRADPSASTVIGNAKGDALDVYNLAGTRVQHLPGGFGNVDVRHDFPLGSGSADIAAVTSQGLKIFRVDQATGLLTNATAGGSIANNGGEGLCLYHSPVSGLFSVFQVTIGGHVIQTEIGDADGDGLVSGRVVRSWDLGSEGEGCVTDDETGSLYM
ncbi:MAG TPA: phytase, partial [Acidimicrobiia bacterium]|nr:phytase [Acidimicrobiia bacterium]